MSRNDWDDGAEREPGDMDGFTAGLFWVVAIIIMLATLWG